MALPRQTTQQHQLQPHQKKLPFPGKGGRRPILMVQPGVALPVWSISLAGDDKRLVVASRDRFAHVWDLVEGSEGPGFENTIGAMGAVALSANGRWLAGADERIVHLWDFAGGEEANVFKGHDRSIEALAISAEGSRLATCAKDGVRLWDRSSPEARHDIRPKDFRIRAVAISADGKWFVTGGDDRVAHLWSADTGEEIRRFSGHTDPIRALALSSDGKHLFTASDDESACIWDLASGALIRSFFHDDKVIALAPSKDGKWLATGSEDRLAILWDIATAEKLQTFRGHTVAVRSAALTADGRRLFTGGGGEGDAMRLWDTATGKELCVVVSFKVQLAEIERGWAVIDANSNFDCSNHGNAPGLTWVVGSSLFPLAKLKDNYTPGLLAKHLSAK